MKHEVALRSFSACAAALALLAGAGAAAAQLTVPKEPPPEARHTVTGRVLVDRRGGPDQALEVILESKTGGGRQEVFSEASGRFVFRNVPSGSYVITVRAPYKSPYGDGRAELSIHRGYASANYSVDVTMPLRLEEARGAPVGGATVAAVDPDRDVAPEARKLYERSVALAEQGQLEAAAERCREALDISPGYLSAANDLGVYLLRLERVEESIEVLRRAVEMGPKTFGPRMNLGLALFAADDVDGAAAEVDAALTLEPASSRALYLAGQISMRRGRVAEAVDRLQRAYAAGDATRPAVALALGHAYEAAGAPESAVEAYRVVVALEPEGERAATALERLRALGAN